MNNAILAIIETANGRKANVQDLASNVLVILKELARENHTLRFAINAACDDYCKAKHVEKYGDARAVSWQEESAKMGSNSCHATAGKFHRLNG